MIALCSQETCDRLRYIVGFNVLKQIMIVFSYLCSFLVSYAMDDEEAEPDHPRGYVNEQPSYIIYIFFIVCIPQDSWIISWFTK